MLQHTFSHIRGVGEKAEKALWQAGILDWNNFFETPDIPLPADKTAYIREQLRQSRDALKAGDHAFFTGLLPASHHWRIFREFRNSAAYVDIETTGLAQGYNEITTIALYDGKNIKYYINGHNLDRFPDDIQSYDLLITYNGKCFDIPFMAHFFRTTFHQAHIDLRYVLKNLGYTGGLKGCEKRFGIGRDGLDGVDGYFAVRLWQEYQTTKQTSALETLLAYNIEDVINLEFLMHQAYNLKIQNLPFSDRLLLEIPKKPNVPFMPDRNLIEKMKADFFTF